MPTGRQNKLTGQVAEHLVCAELGRRGLIATPFSGNVPGFDVVAVDASYRAVPIQVKATRADNWPTDARAWMALEYEPATGVQHYRGLVELAAPDLIYVCVVLRPAGDARRDQFFVLTKRDMRDAYVASYTAWMEPMGWRRPRNQESYDCRFPAARIAAFEDNWALIEQRLAPVEPPAPE